jgi:hypothetical protein
LLARSAVETCILGLYCLVSEDAVPSLRSGLIGTTTNILRYLVDDGLIPQDLVERVLAAVWPKGQSPTVWKMATVVESGPGGFQARSLYRRFYAPTSELFSHANAASLLRHVRPNGQIHDRPSFPWTRRSAIHASDACLGILAGAIAKRAGVPAGSFGIYAEAHNIRTLTPLGVIVGVGLRRKLTLATMRSFAVVAREILDVYRYVRSPKALSDTPEERRVRVAAAFDHGFSFLVSDETLTQAAAVMKEHFIDVLLDDLAARERSGDAR